VSRLSLPVPAGLSIAVAFVFVASSSVFAASPDTQLIDAAKNGDVADVKDALAAGARINTKSGPTALLQCLGPQRLDHTLEVIQLLLDQGADINAPGPDGLSAFQVALSSWYSDDCVPLLMPHHPNLSATTEDGDGVVALAIRRGSLQLAHSILDQGAPGDVPDTAGTTPLMLAAQADRNQAWREAEYLDLAKYLIAKGADVQRLDKQGKSAAAYALDNNNYDLLVLLDTKQGYSSKYADVKKADLIQKLSATVEKHRWSKVKMMNGPKVTQIDTMGTITGLLTDGADSNALSIDKRTTIFGQALGDNNNGLVIAPDPVLIQLLLDNGANPNLHFPDGNIPLALAVASPDIFNMLLAKGADPKATFSVPSFVLDPSTGNRQLGTKNESLSIAVAVDGAVENMKTLLDQKIGLEDTDPNGMTPLLVAIANGNTDVARFLIAHGANTEAKSASGQTAADLAASALDIGLLHKLDHDGKYASLLAVYSPPPTAPVVGDWVLTYDTASIKLRLDPDGGGVAETMNGYRALGWKAIAGGFEIDQMFINKRVGIPMPINENVTYDPAGGTLTIQSVFPQRGVTMVYHRPGTPAPTQSIIPPSNLPPSGGADQVASTIAQALTANPQSLSLNQPDLTDFPAAAYQMIGLTNLNINGTKLEKVPSELGRLRLLQRVSLQNNRIDEIGDGFYDLTNLTELDLGMNRLTSISPRICGLTQLANLTFYDNRISELPEGWDKMANLKSLALTGNRLSRLPVSLALTPQLTALSINDNMLSDLPEQWGKFALEYLDLSQNRFSNFPKEMWNIQIHRLNMANNEIKDIPAEIASEVGLEELDLSGNLIATIPNLSQTHLTQLRLAGNQIKAFPATKDAFPSTLRELDLRQNQITEVPDWVFDLNLQSLSLYGNPMPDDTIRSIEQRIRQAYEARRHQAMKH
jgi:Leucine-rich repeat (LRR) protein/ankyrin repeat protein